MVESNDIYSNDRPSASDPLDQQPSEVAHCADISARDEATLRDTQQILTDEMFNVPDKGIVAPIVDWQSRMITLLVQEVSVLHEKVKLAEQRQLWQIGHTDDKLQDFKDHVFDNFDIDDHFDLSDYGYHIEDLIDERMRNNLTDEIKEILRDSTLEINGRIVV